MIRFFTMEISQLKTLIIQSILLEPKKRRFLLEHLEEFTESEREALKAHFLREKEEINEIIEKKLEEDPEGFFFVKLKFFLVRLKNSFQGKTEERERASEREQYENLLTELDHA